MKGLELAEEYYKAYGRKLFEEKFPHLVEHMAVGLVGYGSECLGFDDELSMDHDYGPSFCVWLPRELYQQYGAQVQAAYEELPQEFGGYSGRVSEVQGQGRVGSLCLEDFYLGILGRDTVPETETEWLAL